MCLDVAPQAPKATDMSISVYNPLCLFYIHVYYFLYYIPSAYVILYTYSMYYISVYVFDRHVNYCILKNSTNTKAHIHFRSMSTCWYG